MGQLLTSLNDWFATQVMRNDMNHHCEHQPIGSCSEECAELVLADRW